MMFVFLVVVCVRCLCLFGLLLLYVCVFVAVCVSRLCVWVVVVVRVVRLVLCFG